MYLPVWWISALAAALVFYIIYSVTGYIIPRTLVKDLANKFVLITGCDSGFGRATAIKLDQLGIKVFATCLTKEGSESLKSSCSERVKPLLLDVTKSENIQEVFEAVKQELPNGSGLWGLVNNAGIATFSPVEWTPMSEYKKMADVNLWGLIEVTNTFLPLLRKTKGRIVNLSSIAGRLSIPNTGPYSITKHGVEAFSDALRREIYPWGVGVSVVQPGGVHTNFLANGILEKKLEEIWKGMSEELKATYGHDSYKAHNTALKAVSLLANTDTSEVVEAIVDGLVSRSPRYRYLVGLDSKYVYIWLVYLPTSIADWALRLSARLTRLLLEK